VGRIGLLALFTLIFLAPVGGAIPDSERQALIDFYYATGGPDWTYASKWLGPPGTECDWETVWCNDEATHVFVLYPFSNNLIGSIPSECLSKFLYLESIIIFDNSLSGQIPPDIGDLSLLWWFEASHNQLSGKVPIEFGRLVNLETVYLDENLLTGLPPEIGNLSLLSHLDLHDNLIPELPDTLGRCASLSELDVSANELAGPFPEALLALHGLDRLNLDDNHLSGGIPADIHRLESLGLLGLGSNQLTGEVPASITRLPIRDAGYYYPHSYYDWWLELRYNALYAVEPEVIAWLDRKSPYGYDHFRQTQTAAPEGVAFTPEGRGSGTLSWQPMPYQADPGGYEIFRADLPGGPYTLLLTVADKAASSAPVEGLDPERTTFLAVRGYTEPHPQNRNRVASELSPDVAAGPAFPFTAALAAHAAVTADWWTEIHLANPGLAPARLVFQALSPAGEALEAVETGPVPPGGAFRAELEDIFSPSTLAGDIWFKVWSDAPLRGVLTFGTRDGQAAAVLPLAEPAAELIFSYVYAGKDYYTGLTLVIPGESRARGRLTSYTEGGVAMGWVDLTIPPRSKYVRLVDQISGLGDPLLVRLLRVSSDRPLAGFELFGSFFDGGLAGLPAVAWPAPGPAVVYYNEIPPPDTYYTGVTFSNLGAGALPVTAALFDADGRRLAERVWPVGPMEQVTRQLPFVFDGVVRPEAAYLTASAEGPLLGFELVQTVPGLPLPYVFDGLDGWTAAGGRLDFPLARPAADWTAAVKLTNPGTEPAPFFVYGFEETGASAGVFSDTLPPGGQRGYDLDELFLLSAPALAWFYVETQVPLAGSLFSLSADQARLVSYAGLPAGVSD